MFKFPIIELPGLEPTLELGEPAAADKRAFVVTNDGTEESL